MQQSSNRFLPALEGVRGYAFLLVFLVHYNRIAGKPTEFWLWPYFLVVSMGWLAVPVFFALSGYLITGILYDSKGRSGYFKVFYGRRSLRVFPLYYLVLLAVAIFAWVRHWTWACHLRYFSYFFYAQNFTNTASNFGLGHFVSLGHLWSLAVEEHFYLLWPIVIWLCPDRKSMLRACYFILVACFATRMCWPLFHVSMKAAYWSTFTRADGIVLGAIVALVQRGKGIPLHWTPWSRWVALAGLCLVGVQTAVSGSSAPFDSFNSVFMTPLANMVAAAVLLLLLDSRTALSRACSLPWICKLGRLSYGMYLFHLLYMPLFTNRVGPALAPLLGAAEGQVASAALALGLTWILAALSYRFFEQPLLSLKHLFVYGPAQTVKPVPAGSAESAGWAALPFGTR